MFIPAGNPHHRSHILFAILRTFGLALATPFLLVILFAALVAVLVDSAFFRLRTALAGESHPKGIWEL